MTDNSAPATTGTPAALRDIVIERVFDAPRELVWQAWTNPEHVMRWWGPKDFTSPTCQIDLRVGGKYIFSMQWPGGGDKMYSTGTYLEIVPPERLVYTDSFSDADGNVKSGADYGMENYPEMITITVTLESMGDNQTKMTVLNQGVPAGEMGDMTEGGWIESFDKLAASLQ